MVGGGGGGGERERVGIFVMCNLLEVHSMNLVVFWGCEGLGGGGGAVLRIPTFRHRIRISVSVCLSVCLSLYRGLPIVRGVSRFLECSAYSFTVSVSRRRLTVRSRFHTR